MTNTTKEEKEKVFIVGSGFSKALYSKMPLLNELSEAVSKQLKKESPIWKRIYDELIKFGESAYKKKVKEQYIDFEQLLTFLYQDFPWKSVDEKHLSRSLYTRIANIASNIIKKRQPGNFDFFKNPNKEIKQFFEYLDINKAKVISFNYDIITESFALKIIERTHLENIYPISIVNISRRNATLSSIEPRDEFELLKLHGSVNWYISGQDAANSPIYYDFYHGDKAKVNLRDLNPLIIPPVLDKSKFYIHNSIKTLWARARSHLMNAETLYIVGYSIPITDLTVRLMLQNYLAKDCRVVIVNRDVNSINDYKSIFGKRLDSSYVVNSRKVFSDFVKKEII